MRARLAPYASGRQPAPGQQGIAVVEMALLLPAFILLLLGLIEVANILRLQMTLNSAVAVMARTVSQDTNITDESGAQAYFNANRASLVPSIQQHLDTDTPNDPPALTMSPADKPECTETPCTPFLISISYKYSAITPLMQSIFDNLTLSASAKRTSEPNSGTKIVSN